MRIKLRDNIQVGNKLIRRGSVLYFYSVKQKAKKILTEEELKMIESLDGTNQYKYTDWLAIQYKENGVSIEDLSEILTQMKEIPIDFQNKSYDQVKKELERRYEKKEKEYTKGLTLGKDYEFIDKNKNYFVFSPLTEKGSIQLGKKTSWCTSRSDEYNKFDEYDLDRYVKLYYFLPMIGKEKYAIVVNSEGFIEEGRDVDDSYINYNKILKITNFNKLLLKPWKPIKGVHYDITTGDSKKDEILYKLQDFYLDIRKAKINEDFSIDYKGNININLKGLEQIPFNFRYVNGDFNCSLNKSLKNLKGAPKLVKGNFNCEACDSLTSLEGAPNQVHDYFYCHYCESLRNLKGAPKQVNGVFSCRECGVKFTKNDVRQVCDVKGAIYT